MTATKTSSSAPLLEAGPTFNVFDQPVPATVTPALAGSKDGALKIGREIGSADIATLEPGARLEVKNRRGSVVVDVYQTTPPTCGLGVEGGPWGRGTPEAPPGSGRW